MWQKPRLNTRYVSYFVFSVYHAQLLMLCRYTTVHTGSNVKNKNFANFQ